MRSIPNRNQTGGSSEAVTRINTCSPQLSSLQIMSFFKAELLQFLSKPTNANTEWKGMRPRGPSILELSLPVHWPTFASEWDGCNRGRDLSSAFGCLSMLYCLIPDELNLKLKTRRGLLTGCRASFGRNLKRTSLKKVCVAFKFFGLRSPEWLAWHNGNGLIYQVFRKQNRCNLLRLLRKDW